MTENESIEKLMAYQQDLIAEEECLQKLINKIDEQYRSLQVCNKCSVHSIPFNSLLVLSMIYFFKLLDIVSTFKERSE